MTPEERKKFLEEHRLAVVGIPRRSAPPQLSPVYYVMDGEDLIISTTATRAKGKSVLHEPRVSVCVLGEAMPFPYLTVYGHGRIENERVVETMMAVGAKMTGAPIPDSARPGIEDRAKKEQRVVLRVTPESYYP